MSESPHPRHALQCSARDRTADPGVTGAVSKGWRSAAASRALSKTHKGQVEAADVKRIAEELLAAR